MSTQTLFIQYCLQSIIMKLIFLQTTPLPLKSNSDRSKRFVQIKNKTQI